MKLNFPFTFALPLVIACLTWLGVALVKSGLSFWWIAPLLVLAVFVVSFASYESDVRQKLHFWFAALLPALAFAISLSSFGLPTAPKSIVNLAVMARRAIANQMTGISPRAGGLTLGITDGDTSLLSQSTKDLMQQMSLTHLTAVSGTNCTILALAVLSLTAKFGWTRALRITSVVAMLLVYLWLVGEQPSVMRAAAMAVIGLLGQLKGLRFRPANLLALAVMVLLIIDPKNATSFGFTLSVAATAGLLFVSPRIFELLPDSMPQFLKQALSISLGAQLACLPVLVMLQSDYNIGGLIANLLAEPVVAFITLLGFVGSVLALVGLGIHLATPVFWIASLPASWIISEATALRQVFPTVELPRGVVGSTLALGVLAVLLARRWLGRRGFSGVPMAAFLLVLVFLVVQLLGKLPTGIFPGKNWFMVACDVGQGDATVLKAQNEFAVIDVGRDPLDIDNCLTKLGVETISLLVLTHFDLDHVGGLSGAVAGRKVDLALVTQYVDQRPGANSVEALLTMLHIRTRSVSLGDSGWLGSPRLRGSLSYLVLNPQRDGEDSNSPNDGSIAMYWSSKSVGIFTMADVPATGQKRILDDTPMWWNPRFRSHPIILKLSHHGSADQDPKFLAWVHPTVTTISVGKGNSYGHPTAIALNLLARDSALTVRTDQRGSIAIGFGDNGHLIWSASGSR